MSAEGDTVIVENSYAGSEPSVAWSAVVAGALAIAAVAFLLLMLGPAIGLPRTTPWSHETTLGITATTAIWLIIMQWLSSGIGGYLTGRLRHKWRNLHDDEVYFRDTAHGFLAWALATLVTATLLAAASVEAVNIGIHTPAPVPPAPVINVLPSGGAAQCENTAEPPKHRRRPHQNGSVTDRYVDSLLGTTGADDAKPANQDDREQMGRAIEHGMHEGEFSPEDQAILITKIKQHTDLNDGDAQQRVNAMNARFEARKAEERKKAEEAQSTVRHASLFVFISLLIGAFIASAAAALGGIHRDRY